MTQTTTMSQTPTIEPEMSEPTDNVTELLREWREGDAAALDELTRVIHSDLRRLAGRYMRSERRKLTLQPTVLVNEAFLRLVRQDRVQWQSRAHFFAIAARVMRRILVDHARSRHSQKRRLSAQVTLDDGVAAAEERSMDLLDLDEALQALKELDARKSQVVELRIFGGMTIEETAEALEVARGTVVNDFRFAKAWLRRRLEKGHDRGD